MSKFSAKKIKFDPNNLFNSVGNLSVKFSDSEAASSVLAWSSEKIKAYIDNVAQGLDSKNSCRAMTTSALPSCTYDNGTSGVGATLTGSVNGTLADQDGVTLVVSDRLLVKNQDTKSQNGIYEVTTVGDASNPFVLTRTSDFDDSPDGEVSGGAYCFIQEGSVGEDTGWVLTTNGSITIGTTELDFSQFSGTGQITSGVGLTKDGSTVQIGDGNTGNKNGISRTSSDIGIATGIGVEVNSDLLRLASTAAGDALTGGSGTTLSVVASDLTGAGLEDDGSNNIRISSTAAGDGLQGGSGSALAIDVADFAGTGLEESGGDLRISTSAAGDGITGGSGAALSVVSDTIGGSSLSTSINVSANGVAVKIDDSSIGENASHQLEVKDGGITIPKLSPEIQTFPITFLNLGSTPAWEEEDYIKLSLHYNAANTAAFITSTQAYKYKTLEFAARWYYGYHSREGLGFFSQNKDGWPQGADQIVFRSDDDENRYLRTMKNGSGSNLGISIDPNTLTYYKFVWQSGEVKVYKSSDGTNWTLVATKTDYIPERHIRVSFSIYNDANPRGQFIDLLKNSIKVY